MAARGGGSSHLQKNRRQATRSRSPRRHFRSADTSPGAAAPSEVGETPATRQPSLSSSEESRLTAAAKPHFQRFARKAAELLAEKAAEVRKATLPRCGLIVAEARNQTAAILEADESRGKRLEELREKVDKLHKHLRMLASSEASPKHAVASSLTAPAPSRLFGSISADGGQSFFSGLPRGRAPTLALPPPTPASSLMQQRAASMLGLSSANSCTPFGAGGLLRRTNRPRLLG